MEKNLPDNTSKPKKHSASSGSNETSQVQTLQNVGSSTTITRPISTQTSQISKTAQGLSSLQTDASPWTVGGGGLSRNPRLLPPTSLSSTFGTRSNSTSTLGTSGISTQPRSSLPYSSTRLPVTRRSFNRPPRTAFGGTTTGSYTSGTRPSPVTTVRDTTPNTNIIRPIPIRNEDLVPTYPNNSLKRGKALIINNIKFMDTYLERLGAEKDSEDLEKLLKKIGFDVEVKKDRTGQQMANKLEQFSKTNFNNYDASMVVIMSHGENTVNGGPKVIPGGYTEILGIDNETLVVDDVLEKFTATNADLSLRGKPKIFIFQCCRGRDVEKLCHDAPIKEVINDHSDMLIAWSTLPGYVSNRNPRTGTWFIQSIYEVFEQQYQKEHIEDMLRTVNIKLSTKLPNYTQTAPFENRGFKRCYLYKRNTQ